MRRLFPLHIALLALLSSCRSDGTGQEPMDLLGTVPWQREEWGRCAREIEEHLAPEGRESQMSALDAAFYDILSRDGALADYLQQEKGPLQLLVRGNRYLCLPSTLSLTVKDGASVAGSFSLHLSGSDVNGNASLDEGDQIDLDFTGESAGLQLLASPVQMSGAVASATVRFLSDGYQLAQLTLESADFRFDPESFFLGVTQLALDLPGGIAPDLPTVELSGTRQLYMAQHRGVLSYSTELVEINGGAVVIRVSGRGLQLLAMTDTELRIGGVITAVELVG